MGPFTIVSAAWLAGAASVALFAGIRGRAKQDADPDVVLVQRKRVVLVRPCAGIEPELHRTLSSTRNVIAASMELRVLLAVADGGDDAYPVARNAVAEFLRAGMNAELVITAAVGPNRKADQLARALEGSSSEVVIVADSDVDLSGLDLDALVLPFEDEAVAAVWAPPCEVAPTTWADRASASLLDSSMHAFAVLGALDERGMVGKLVALRSRDLDAVFGFGSLRDCLGEDMELARRFRKAGRRVVRHTAAAPSRAQGRTSRAVVERYSRWISVIRAQRPLLLLSYPFVISPTVPLLVLMLVSSAREGAKGLLLLPLLALYRAFVAVLARGRSKSGRPFRGLLVDALLADLLLGASFLRALRSRALRWRGVPLRIGRGGGLFQGDAP